MRKNKYGAKRVTYQGLKFDSQHERDCWIALLDRKKRGEISDLKRQVSFHMEGRDGPILTPTGLQARYVADFTYIEKGVLIIEDAKGMRTEVYKLKKAILAAQGIFIRES